MQQRPIILTFRVNDAEREYIVQAADALGLSVSGFLRFALAKVDAEDAA